MAPSGPAQNVTKAGTFITGKRHQRVVREHCSHNFTLFVQLRTRRGVGRGASLAGTGGSASGELAHNATELGGEWLARVPGGGSVFLIEKGEQCFRGTCPYAVVRIFLGDIGQQRPIFRPEGAAPKSCCPGEPVGRPKVVECRSRKSG